MMASIPQLLRECKWQNYEIGMLQNRKNGDIFWL